MRRALRWFLWGGMGILALGLAATSPLQLVCAQEDCEHCQCPEGKQDGQRLCNGELKWCTCFPGSEEPGLTPTPGLGQSIPTPGAPRQPPPPTPTPPPGAQPGGHYEWHCVIIPDPDTFPGVHCPMGHVARVLFYVEPAGRSLPVEGHCDDPACRPRPTPTPAPPPCPEPPTFDRGSLSQPCSGRPGVRWPGTRLEARVQLPPNRLTVRPWPRTLVTLPARLWWAGPDRLEAWSAPALPCHPDVTAGQTYTDPAQFPTCAGGRAQAGTTAYHRIGVAWQRWTLAAGPLFGFRPPGAFELFVQDRDPQDPIHRLREVYLPVDPGSDRLLLSYAWSTASFPTTPDLLPRGPRWNPECQTRDCPAPERVIAWDMPAYRLRVRSWWRAQWAHRYLLLRAVEWQTICRPVPDADADGRPDRPGPCTTVIGDPPTPWPGEWVQQPTRWRWEEVFDGWHDYDLRRFGLPTPLLPWEPVQSAAADPWGHPASPFGPTQDALYLPVIEIQVIHAP